MWISLFTFAAGAAVCLSVAAIMMQSLQSARSRVAEPRDGFAARFFLTPPPLATQQLCWGIGAI
jgi:hypothetical protein